MKRIILCLAVGAGLMAGCSETQAVATAAGLSGTYDLTAVGNYVFVTSSDNNELRVLDIGASPRDFVRAPNPLEALSIPVLERPTYLTRDVYYRVLEEPGPEKDEQGNPIPLPRGSERVGPYVYARSDGAQEISIVSASASDERNLRELHRLGRSEPLGFVTAFAARGPGQQGTGSILYYATQQASGATLWRQPLPPPEELNPDSALPPRTSVLEMPGETVAALLVLASAPSTDATPPEQEYVVVATRGTQGAVGRTFRLDASRPQEPVVNYAFPAPVRLLATHPVVANTVWAGDVNREVPNLTTDDPTDTRTIEACGIDPTQPARSSLRAGEYVFAVLDESSCAGGTACTGVLAVDSATGMIPLDSTNAPMLPIRLTPGLPTGLTLVPDTRLSTRCANPENHELPRPLVGVVPSSDGQISIFDAVKLRPFDFDQTNARVAGLSMTKADATRLNTRDAVDTYIGVELVNGATRSDTYRMVYEGLLPAPRDPVLSGNTSECGAAANPTGCTFTYGSPREARFVLINDLIVLEPDDAACELKVTDKQEVGGVVKLSTGPIPDACKDRQRFGVRAGPESALPFVVYSDSRGAEGRIAEGQANALTLEGGYYFHPPDFNPQLTPFQVKLTLKDTEKQAPGPRPARGDQYVASVQSGFLPYIFSPDTGSLGAGLGAYRLPGPVAHTRFQGISLAYIAYPSADGILQVNMGSVTDGGAQITGLAPFQ